jgi:hypothetical protein
MNFVYDHISNDTSNDVGNDVKEIICGFTSLSSDKFHKEQPWACLGIINGILSLFMAFDRCLTSLHVCSFAS